MVLALKIVSILFSILGAGFAIINEIRADPLFTIMEKNESRKHRKSNKH